MLSDHKALLMFINIKRPPYHIKYIMHRKLNNLDINQIKLEMREMEKDLKDINDPNELTSIHNKTLTEILDKHSPRKKLKITIRNKTPWTTEEIRKDKTEKCRLERKWLKQNWPLMDRTTKIKETNIMLCSKT